MSGVSRCKGWTGGGAFPNLLQTIGVVTTALLPSDIGDLIPFICFRLHLDVELEAAFGRRCRYEDGLEETLGISHKSPRDCTA